MTGDFNDFLKKYDYELPKSLVAQKPASPRDMAKLLIYNRQTNRIYCDRFINLTRYLPKNSVLVFNDTKVLPARISVKKETGGKAGIFYLKTDGDLIKAIPDRHLTINSPFIFCRF